MPQLKSNQDRLVSISKRDLDSLEATLETLEEEEAMRQLRESEKDIEKGRTREARQLIGNLEE